MKFEKNYEYCTINMINDMDFESKIEQDLHQYLTGLGVLDERMPECVDIEDKWENIANAYLPDGVREFNDYPMVSLGWIMFVGMALAKYWDEDWAKYCLLDCLYENLRDARGYDYMDEYILEDVLKLDAAAQEKTGRIVQECAARLDNVLRHASVEPGTKAAFDMYVACLHQLYIMGAAVQLNAMGYHMVKM